MGMTMSEKILARHSSQAVVSPGDVVNVSVDWAVDLDIMYNGARITKPLKLFDRDRVIVVADHMVPAASIEVANGLNAMRRYVEEMGIKWLFDVGNQGISHQIVGENGFALPGQILTCTDSHTLAGGAFNCAARGMGATEMLYIMAKGETWFICSPTVRFILSGELKPRVQPRDVLHYIAGVYGDFANTNLEFVGDAAAGIPVSGRQTISAMSAEVSAEFALWEADSVLLDYLDGRSKAPFEPVFSDDDAHYEAIYEIDLSAVEPGVALPGSVPNNVRPASSLAEVKLTQCFIGSCANGRVEDFAIAAEVVRGRRVAPGVQFIVTPSSQHELLEATRRGYVQTLLEAGAVVTPSTCGACFGGHMGVLGDDDICLTASTRNFQGRMGSPKAQIYLGSPATVAASAITGHITDPRDV